MKTLLSWLLNSVALIGLTYYLPGISVSSFGRALIVVVVLGLVNALIKPLVLILTLPINILTLGLFTFVVNALMFWMVGWLIEGFYVAGFVPAFWGALAMMMVGWIINIILNK
ncbi:MAG TPA: phage holin family protein [Candidatus Magasanikbacteria bacterium]|nr:phage holin family protein [Candidatus Magasanikbacteria bacterium]